MVEFVGWWLLCIAVWLAALTVATPAEAVAAAAAGLACAWVARRARRQVAAGWKVRARWLAGAWRLPGTVVLDTARVWGMAVREPGAAGHGREVHLGSGAERAMRVALLSTSPGLVVVDTGGARVRIHAMGARPDAIEKAPGR